MSDLYSHAYMDMQNKATLCVEFVGPVSWIVTPLLVMNPDLDGHVDVRALWDTGAKHCLISRRLYENLCLKFIDAVTLAGVTGEEECVSGKVMVAICVGASFLNVDAVVVDNFPGHSFDFVAGMNLINKGEFAIKLNQGKTVFSFSLPSERPVSDEYECDDPSLIYP